MSSLREFYAYCHPSYREFYSALIHDWSSLGQPYDVVDREVHCQFRQQHPFPVVYSMQSEPGSKHQLVVNVHPVRVFLGDVSVDQLKKQLDEKFGRQYACEGDVCILREPAQVSGDIQSSVRTMLRCLGARLAGL